MMDGMNLFEMMKGVAERGIANQVRREKDYIGEDGMLICGVCGEPRQKMLFFANPTDEEPNRETPLKVSCFCRCDKEREAKEKRREQAKKDIDRIASLINASLMDERFREATFDRFEINRYNERNLKLCRRYADKFDLMIEKNQGLLLWGGVGTGKTFAAACIANELLKRQVPVMMTSFVKLLEMIQSGKEHDAVILSKLNRAKLVIFDDLGAERGTEYALEKVYSIVDERYRKKLPSIYTTNLSVPEMEQESDVRYGRIYDRIFETCYPMQFTGQSWRRKEAGHRFAEMEHLLND